MWLGTREVLIKVWLDESLFVATCFGETTRQVKVRKLMESFVASMSFAYGWIPMARVIASTLSYETTHGCSIETQAAL
jgi:hypothetical protein